MQPLCLSLGMPFPAMARATMKHLHLPTLYKGPWGSPQFLTQCILCARGDTQSRHCDAAWPT